jgi:aspartate-semialdehyde dehydrogenase
MPEPVIVIVGADSLAGRELREILGSGPLAKRLRLLSGESAESIFSSGGDEEAVVIAPLEEENLEDATVVFLAGDAASSRRAYTITKRMRPAPVLVDLSFGLEDLPEARLRSPMVEPPGYQIPPDSLHVVAQPAAAAVALLLSRLHAVQPVRHSVVEVFEPASERGARGVEELQKQTVNLLSFRQLPQEVFDAQIGFNLLPRYGTAAKEPLADFEMRIERHLASLLSISGGAPIPSLRLVQAPVFHGYSISAWVEFAAPFGAGDAARALSGAPVEIRSRDEEPATNVGAAGQSGVTISVDPDRNNPRALWFWMVADNLRLAADDAMLVAAGLVGAK